MLKANRLKGLMGETEFPEEAEIFIWTRAGSKSACLTSVNTEALLMDEAGEADLTVKKSHVRATGKNCTMAAMYAT